MASSLPPIPSEDVRAFAAGLRARGAQRRASTESRAERLRALARDAAAALEERFGATAVWLYGSLAWGEPHDHSDVDLLVEGLPESAWLAAGAEAEAVIGAPVDLLRAEDAPASLVARVHREGIRLHGR